MVIESTKKVDIKGAGKMKKERVQAPLSKIIIRKLPPSFTEEEFKNAISPVPENSYFSFVPADKGLGVHSYSRAYINFLNPDEILSFRDRFDGYVFVDQKGNEYPALVEYSPFQKIPKYNLHKKDIRCGTVDEDPDYVAFLDLLQNPEIVTLPQIESLLEEIETAERELRANNGVIKIKTPLLEYVEQRNAERFRPGDRKRRKEFDKKKIREEEKRRRRDYIKEYRKRDEYYTTREERDRERMKRKEEEKLKWKEKREEKEKLRKERIEKYKTDEKTRGKESAADGKENTEELPSKDTPNKEEKGRTPPQRTKRYSEVRKKEEKEKKQKEEKIKLTVDSEENLSQFCTLPEVPDIDFNLVKISIKHMACEDEINEVPPPPGLVKKDVCMKDGNEVPPPPGLVKKDIETLEKEEEYDNEYDKEENEDKDERVTYDKGDEDYDDGKDDRDDKSGKDPRTERRIRNKDRPAMQLYRPGQARLKTRLKPNEEGGIDGESSSSSASPIMGVSEEKEKENEKEKEKEKEMEKEKENNEQDYKTGKGYMGRGGYEKKYTKYKESRGHHHYWDDRETGHSKYKEDYETSTRGRGGTRRGYSYHQERENKGKWSGRSRENESSQFKSMTFRRSTSQE